MSIAAAGNGDWNSITPNAPWPSGTIPTITDAVDLNGKAVTLAATANCLSLVNGTGTGTLTMGNNSILNCATITTAAQVIVNGTNCVINAQTITATTVTAIFVNDGCSVSGTGNITGGSSGSVYGMDLSGSGGNALAGTVISWYGNVTGGAGSSSAGLYSRNGVVRSWFGNVTAGGSASAYGVYFGYSAFAGAGIIYNWYGDIRATTIIGLYLNHGATVVSWYGNVYGGTANGAYGINNVLSTQNIYSWYGNVYGGTVSGAHGVSFGNQSLAIYSWVGDIFATVVGAYGVYTSNSSGNTGILSWYGNLHANTGCYAVYCTSTSGTRVFYTSIACPAAAAYQATPTLNAALVTAAWQVMMFGGNVYTIAYTGDAVVPNPTTIDGYLITSAKSYQLATGTGTIVDPSTVLVGAAGYPTGTRVDCPTADARHKGIGYYKAGGASDGTCYVPAAANVRSGISVDATSGTCIVPAASSVAYGVPVDVSPGVGTAVLTAQAAQNAATTALGVAGFSGATPDTIPEKITKALNLQSTTAATKAAGEAGGLALSDIIQMFGIAGIRMIGNRPSGAAFDYSFYPSEAGDSGGVYWTTTDQLSYITIAGTGAYWTMASSEGDSITGISLSRGILYNWTVTSGGSSEISNITAITIQDAATAAMLGGIQGYLPAVSQVSISGSKAAGLDGVYNINVGVIHNGTLVFFNSAGTAAVYSSTALGVWVAAAVTSATAIGITDSPTNGLRGNTGPYPTDGVWGGMGSYATNIGNITTLGVVPTLTKITQRR